MSYIVDTIDNTDQNITFWGYTIWEFIPTWHEEFKPLSVYWIDGEANCEDKSLRPAFTNTEFNFTSGQMTNVTVSGLVVQAGAHLDDGGQFANLMVNGQTFCSSAATYNATSAFVEPNAFEDKNHISNMTICYNTGFVQAGDKLSIEAFYNSQAYPLRLEPNATPYPVMGIGLAYVAPFGDVKHGHF
jgi:hypothetical protein